MTIRTGYYFECRCGWAADAEPSTAADIGPRMLYTAHRTICNEAWGDALAIKMFGFVDTKVEDSLHEEPS